jgi:LacI family transcriptional regulator
MRKRFTIEDVARLAGVGKVTVSYVLNGRAQQARISQETCDRVLIAAKELEYRPSAVARSLVSKRADAVSLVFQFGEYFSAGSSFINEVMRGVCEACVAADLNLVLHTRSFKSPVEEAHALMDGRADGALILRDYGDPMVEQLVARGYPVVLFFTRSSDGSVDFVDADNFSGGRLATQHLLDLGHERIGMVRGSKGSVASNDRIAGYHAALSECDITSKLNDLLEVDVPDDVSCDFVNWVRETGITGLVCWSDDVAFRCMHALSSAGFSLPDDLSIVGFDSSEACDRCNPPLTSVRQPIYEMGYAAARKLIAKIRSEADATSPSIYPLTLDVRGSTLAAKQSSSMKRTS